MWKYLKGTEKDFEGFSPTITLILEGIEVVSQREWVEEPIVETKPEEQQTLPDMNPAKDLPKIKLDVKKPIFDKATDLEAKFIYSNNKYLVFELSNGGISYIASSRADDHFYNKPDVKTTKQLISDALTYACNNGSLCASPTQLFYMAIEQLVKDGVVDMNKVYEVKQ